MKTCLIIGLVSTCGIYALGFIPHLSAFLLPFVLLITEEFCLDKIFKPSQASFLNNLRTKPSAFLSISFLLIPTTIFCGSGLGLLRSPSNFLINYLFSICIFLIGIGFCLLLTQSLWLHCESDFGFFKSVDRVGLALLKNLKSYLAVGLIFSSALVFSDWSGGLLLIPLLPLFYISNYVLYKKSSPYPIARVLPKEH